MRTTAIFFLAGFLQVSAHSYDQEKITLSEKDAPLIKVIDDIQKQTIYTIWYDKSVIPSTATISIELKDVSLQQALDLCLKNLPLEYSIVGKNVVIQEKGKKQNTDPPGKIDVHGKVVNEKGEPGIGVSIGIKGSVTGMKTDMEGIFQFSNIDENAVLIFSGTNIETLEEKLNGRKNIIVIVKIKINKLDDVEIIGYGSTTKRLNTGDVSTVSAETISEQPVMNPLAALEGRVAGLVITQDNGIPGSTFHVQIRGQNSLSSGNDPLYIIDGVPFNSATITQNNQTSFVLSPFNNLNPADIESISILKDADATSIYGSRGANGVILITTKKGKSGKTALGINVYTGPGQVTNQMHLLNTQQYLAMRHEAFANDVYTPNPGSDPDILVWDTTRYTDWQKQLIGNTMHSTDAQVSLSGGNTYTQFLIAGNFHHETSVFPGDFADNRGGMHLNLSHASLDRKLSISFSTSFSVEQNDLPAVDLSVYDLYLPPDAPPVYDSAGKLNWAGNAWNNPMADTKRTFNTQTDNLIGSMHISYLLLKGLTLKAGLGYTRTWVNETVQYPEISLNPAYGLESMAQFGNSQLRTWNVEPQLEYDVKVGPGKLETLAGVTLLETTDIGYTLNASGYNSDALLSSIAGASVISTANTTDYQYRYSAIFGRINYNIADEMILNFTGRRDGSSRFGPGKQFANFGSVGVAWIFTKLKGLQDHPSNLSFGKLRASYGSTGNDQIGNYQFMSTYSPTYYPYQNMTGLIANNLANPDYSWEINRKSEAGLDLGFFKDRLLASISYYYNRSSNQIVATPLPGITGFTSITANLPALVQNTGLEADLNATILKSAAFTWKASFNISFPKNKLVSFPGLENSAYAYQYVIGQPLRISKLYNLKGVDPLTGIYQFFDSGGKTTFNPAYPQDATNIIDYAPKYYGGFFNSFQWNHWQLDIFLQFTKQTGSLSLPNYAPGQLSNQSTAVLAHWQKPGEQTNTQKFTAIYGDTYNAYSNAYSALSVADASFLRLKNLSLSYMFTSAFLTGIHLNSLRVYIQAQNLFTITSYKGLDPETQGALPPIKLITAGIQLSL